MSRPPGEPLTKITLNLFAEDVRKIKRRFPDCYTEAIRHEIRKWVNKMESNEREREYE